MEVDANSSSLSGSLGTDVDGFAQAYRDSEVVIATAHEIDMEDVRRIITPALGVAIARVLQAEGFDDATKIAFVVAVVLAGQKLANAERMAIDSLNSSAKNSVEE